MAVHSSSSYFAISSERHVEASFKLEEDAEGGVDFAAFDGADVVAVEVGAGAEFFLGGAAGGALNLLQFPTLNHRCEITGGVREAECRALLQSFFAEQRAARKNGARPTMEM